MFMRTSINTNLCIPSRQFLLKGIHQYIVHWYIARGGDILEKVSCVLMNRARNDDPRNTTRKYTNVVPTASAKKKYEGVLFTKDLDNLYSSQ